MQVDYILSQRKSPHQGLTMKAMVKGALGPTQPTIDAPSTLDTRESQRNYKITARLNAKNWMGMVKTRVVLPKDKDIPKAQAARQAEFFRQSAMPWGNNFMVTPTDAERLNNPAQSAFVKQRQLNVGSDYGRFYAFMHAMSAAFGNLSQRS